MAAHKLPAEIRFMILQALVEDGCNLARFATVSREWQAIIEQHTFARIRLTPSRINELDVMTSRNRAYVCYLWLCIELERYDCTGCTPEEEVIWTTSGREGTIIMKAFQDLFSVLSDWEPDSCLSLDISVYSTSDSEHWFKYLTFEPDALSNMRIHDQKIERTVLSGVDDVQHRWDTTDLGLIPAQCAITRVFVVIRGDETLDDEEQETEWWRQLPLVPAVTRLLMRRQTRRRWDPLTLAEMFARFPNLRELYYEPWREWDDGLQECTDECYLDLLESPALKGLSKLAIFESFSQRYAYAFPPECSHIRAPNSSLSRTLYKVSLNIESLSGSFMVDANDFFMFDKDQPPQKWPNLNSLVLTSQLLAPDKSYRSIMNMLRAAATTAIHMPQLKTLEIWNGGERLAALFKYEHIGGGQPSIITWKGTWDLILEPSVIQAWEAVTIKRSGYGVKLVYESLDSEKIVSYGDAMFLLKLPELVIRPISLQQIRIEQSFGRVQNA